MLPFGGAIVKHPFSFQLSITVRSDDAFLELIHPRNMGTTMGPVVAGLPSSEPRRSQSCTLRFGGPPVQSDLRTASTRQHRRHRSPPAFGTSSADLRTSRGAEVRAVHVHVGGLRGLSRAFRARGVGCARLVRAHVLRGHEQPEGAHLERDRLENWT